MPRARETPLRTLRCAIYTRKSHEEGLEQDLNSLDAQREACEAYIISQKHEGWAILPDFYDDDGISGATMERPALQRLLKDVRAKRVDVVVVYKVDRLSRSLSDFARIVDTFDEHGVSFVSVTQQFNTTTSMGRLTLNVLLSFAQFEREVTAERIRDKIAASKRKGMWMGGVPPLGYDIDNRKLVVNETEARTVCHIFRRYLELGSVPGLVDVLRAEGVLSKERVSESGRKTGGVPFNRGALYHLLQNRIYRGEITHKGESYPGLHEAIVPDSLWNAVQERLAANRVERRTCSRSGEASLLAGLIFDDDGQRMTPTHAVKKGRRYRYYVSRHLTTGRKSASMSGRRVPASEIERIVAECIQQIIENQQDVLEAVQARPHDIGQQEQLMKRIKDIAPAWPTLEPAALRRILLSLIVRIDMKPDRVDVLVRPNTLADLTMADLTMADLTFDTCGPIPDTDGPTRLLSIPARLKRTGVEVRMIVDDDSPLKTAMKPNRGLVRLLLTARRYHELVLDARGRSIQEICKDEGVTRSYFTRVLRLAYLAPDIVTRIAAGSQPANMTASTLKAASCLPLTWTEQRQLFGS